MRTPAIPPARAHLKTQERRGNSGRLVFARATSGSPARHHPEENCGRRQGRPEVASLVLED